MPNGFHGSADEWARLEAPYVRIDPTLARFATEHSLELRRNYRGADRSVWWDDGVNRAIWVHPTQNHGVNGTYQVSILAFHDIDADRYLKHAVVAEEVAPDELIDTLERARRTLACWSRSDLHPARPGGERPEKL